MPKCENCIHCDVCDRTSRQIYATIAENGICRDYKDKSMIVELPYKPMPMVMERSHSDVYCPYCGENLSGYYGDCDVPDILPCFSCGKWLDNTKSMSREEAEKALRESEENESK